MSLAIVLISACDNENEHTHSFTIDKSNEIKHWKECSCGEKREEKDHTFDGWVITKEATATATGLKEKECGTCHYKEIEDIPVLTHSHQFNEWTITKNPTETEEGKKERKCSICQFKEFATIPVIEEKVKLKYEINLDGTSYSVVGIEKLRDSFLIIPKEYNGLPVTSIRNHAFEDCSSLMSVTIPESVTSIEDLSFFNCYRLVEIYNLSSLNITIGSSDNGGIGYYAKVIHTSLEEESNLITKDDYVFYKDDKNKYYLVGYNGTATDLELPNDIEGNTYEINRYVFFKCKNLTSITIPNNVTSIGAYVFTYCDSLTSVTLGNGVTSIGAYAFSGCSNLTSITIPESVTSIGAYVFAYCHSLTSIALGNGVASIGADTFEGCSKLKEVYYNGTVDEWGNVQVSSSNSSLNSATIYYYSETKPTTSGNYWHYVDGSVIKW